MGSTDAAAVVQAIVNVRSGVRRGFVVWASTAVATGATLRAMNEVLTWTHYRSFYDLDWIYAAPVACAIAIGLHRLTSLADAARSALLLPDLSVETIGGLVQVLAWPNKRVQRVARLRLITVLPNVAETHAVLLSPTHMAALCDTLSVRDAITDEHFVCAVLSALPCIGSSQALPSVRQLASMPAFTLGLNRVRHCARAVLPDVERRVAQLRVEGADCVPVGAGASPQSPARGQDQRGALAETQRSSSRPTMRRAILIGSWAITVPFGLFLAYEQHAAGNPLGSVAALLAVAFGTLAHRFGLTDRQTRRLREMVRSGDLAEIGQLIEALTWPDPDMCAVARQGLTTVLPRLRASDGRLLHASHRSILRGYLTRQAARAYSEFVIAILAAYEQVGDMESVPLVEALAAGDPRSARERQVAEAAARCLPYLRECAHATLASQTLLRPASAPGPPAETLLRPAQPGAASDPALLVRPRDGA